MKASRWEIVGAWLHIWTPPRDVEIPPLPRRATAVVVALCVAATGLVFAVIAPAIDRAKQRDAADRARDAAVFERRERARLALDQRPRAARAPSVARLYAADRVTAARAALLADVRVRVGRDARARVAAGTLDAPVGAVRCRYLPRVTGSRVALSCLAVTSRGERTTFGQPFTAAGSLRDGRYAWCHENPRPAEGGSGTGVFVTPSWSCRP